MFLFLSIRFPQAPKYGKNGLMNLNNAQNYTFFFNKSDEIQENV